MLLNKFKNIVPFFKSPAFIASFILALLQTFIGLFTDKYIFLQEVFPSVKYIIYRLALLFILIFIWYCVIRFITRVKNKEKIYSCYLINFLFYFAVYSIIMFMIWPGHWVADEKGIIQSAVALALYSWQHIFTSLFYNFSLMIFPSPAAIVITQYTIISVIISFIVSNTYLKYGKKGLLLNVVFFLPSVIVNVFYPMRLILFAYLELLFFYLLYQNKDKKKFKNTTLLGLSVLNIVLAVWRTECLFMVIILPLFLFIKKVPGKKILAVFLLVISVSCSSVLLQNYFLKINGVKIKYSVTGIVRPFHKLLKEEYADNPKSQLISEISEYMDIENAFAYENGIDALWHDCYAEVDSDTKYKTMIRHLFILLKKHPQAFIEERVHTFSETMCYWNENSELVGVVHGGNLKFEIFDLNVYFKGKAINTELRKNVLQFLYANTGNKAADFVFSLSYNLFIPLAFLLFLFIKSFMSFIKRKNNWCCLIISGTLIIQNFLIFMTAPENFFMYYYPLVVCSYSLFALFVIKKTSKLKSHKFSFLTGGKNENKK